MNSNATRMSKDPLFKDLLREFSRLYWLKPADIVWNAVPAYHIRKFVGKKDTILDLGCGDGLFSAITFGACFPLKFDRFLNAIPQNQAIKKDQSGDIYSNPTTAPKMLRRPIRNVNVGLELKAHHLKVAASLGIYDTLIKADFREIPCPNDTFDKVYSAMAFYWGDKLSLQMKEVHRILKVNGQFLVTLSSEHMRNMHLSMNLAERKNISPHMREYLLGLDGGRRDFVARHSGTPQEWKSFFEKHGFETIDIIPMVNEIMFMLQDISQRPFLKMFLKMAGNSKFKTYRNKVKKYLCDEVYTDFIDEMIRYEGDSNIFHGMYLVVARKV